MVMLGPAVLSHVESSWTSDGAWVPSTGRQALNPWATRGWQKLADVIQLRLLRSTLRGLGGPSVITGMLMRRTQVSESERGWGKQRLERCKEGAPSQGWGRPLESGEGKQVEPPLGPPEGRWLRRHLDFSSVGPVRRSSLGSHPIRLL